MKRIFLTCFGIAIVVAIAFAQRPSAPGAYPPYELKLVYPHETSPAQYEQVSARELQQLADQGWELVSVTPYIYRNEERGGALPAPRPMVTQTYPAYFFKRLKR